MEDLRKRLILAGLFIFLIISLGTAGFMGIEGRDLLDSLYMTIITLTTVGYKEVHELSRAGIVFNISLIIGGLARYSMPSAPV